MGLIKVSEILITIINADFEFGNIGLNPAAESNTFGREEFSGTEVIHIKQLADSQSHKIIEPVLQSGGVFFQIIIWVA